MSSKTYLRLLQGGVLASLIIVFFVFKGMLFPYITSKQLPFNILTEFLFAFWLVFIMRYPQYRPKKNLISYGLIAYFLAVLVSCFISVDFNLSFWGDAERMLGFFHLAHFLLFYYILITVFRHWSEWKVLFASSVVIATIISLIGLFGANPYSQLGNTAYVSGYLIFNLFFCAILFLRSPEKLWRYAYLLPVVVMLFEFKSCRTSGAIIGLAFSVLLGILLFGLFHKQKKVRRSALIVVAIFIIAVIAIFSQHNSAWFQKSFLKNLTSQKITFQTRLISWRGAARDFKYHPIFGTGFGNYAIIFDRQFDPTFFNYMNAETYFDRAHNNLIDIASTTGLVGLITYLSIFAAVLYYLGAEFKKNGSRIGKDESGQRNMEIIILISLVSAYFIQNLAVFDSFVTYIGLMIMLGFIYWRKYIENSEAEEDFDDEAFVSGKRFVLKSFSGEIIVLLCLLFMVYIFTYRFNIRPWRMFTGVIDGYSEIMQGNLEGGIETFRQSLAGTPLDGDGRAILINFISSNPGALAYLSPVNAQNLLDYGIELAEKNVSHNPQDSLMQMQLAQVLNTAAIYNIDNQNKFNYYSAPAVEAINRSIAASPRRIPVYFVKAQILLQRGDNAESIKTLQDAIALNPSYSESYCHLAQFYMILKDEPDMGPMMNKCLDLNGIASINSDAFLKLSINYYLGKNDYNHAIILAEQLSAADKNDTDIMVNLAKLYLAADRKDDALATLQKAFTINPELATSAQKLLNTPLDAAMFK